MTNYLIEFPGLGLKLNPPAEFAIGSFSIRLYGLVIALGLILAVVYALRRREQFGLSEDDLLDGVLWVTPFAILCARAYYCIFSWEEYAADPISALRKFADELDAIDRLATSTMANINTEKKSLSGGRDISSIDTIEH